MFHVSSFLHSTLPVGAERLYESEEKAQALQEEEKDKNVDEEDNHCPYNW